MDENRATDYPRFPFLMGLVRGLLLVVALTSCLPVFTALTPPVFGQLLGSRTRVTLDVSECSSLGVPEFIGSYRSCPIASPNSGLPMILKSTAVAPEVPANEILGYYFPPVTGWRLGWGIAVSFAPFLVLAGWRFLFGEQFPRTIVAVKTWRAARLRRPISVRTAINLSLLVPLLSGVVAPLVIRSVWGRTVSPVYCVGSAFIGIGLYFVYRAYQVARFGGEDAAPGNDQ